VLRKFHAAGCHDLAKWELEIAASGDHYVLMNGPPGCGKSLLAETFPSILPTLSKEAQLEKISLYQLAGDTYSSVTLRPYRHPQVTISRIHSTVTYPAKFIFIPAMNPFPGTSLCFLEFNKK
jgi:magnesium chelatase family protein